MFVRGRIVGRVVAVAALVLALTEAVSWEADAHNAPYTVAAGLQPSGTSVAFTAISSNVVFHDTTTGSSITCTMGALHGSVVTGISASSFIGKINSAVSSFSGCTGPAGIAFDTTGIGTWSVSVADSTNGVNAITLSNVKVNFAYRAGPRCALALGSFAPSPNPAPGSYNPALVTGSYTNSTSKLATDFLNSSMGAWNVKGVDSNTYCVAKSIFNQADRFAMQAVFVLKADQVQSNPITIT